MRTIRPSMGNANDIATLFVSEDRNTFFDSKINEKLAELASLADVEIIDIKYASATDEDGVGWHSALIIYRKADRE